MKAILAMAVRRGRGDYRQGHDSGARSRDRGWRRWRPAGRHQSGATGRHHRAGAGATYVGNFVLPAKDGTRFITIRTAGDEGLPAANQRVDPSQAPLLAKLKSPTAMPSCARTRARITGGCRSSSSKRMSAGSRTSSCSATAAATRTISRWCRTISSSTAATFMATRRLVRSAASPSTALRPPSSTPTSPTSRRWGRTLKRVRLERSGALRHREQLPGGCR